MDFPQWVKKTQCTHVSRTYLFPTPHGYVRHTFSIDVADRVYARNTPALKKLAWNSWIRKQRGVTRK